jgi:trimeric autotransporter adhesin
MRLFIVLGLLAAGVASAQNYDTAFGQNALFNNSSGSYDSAFGAYSLFENSTSNFNTAVGMDALYYNFGNSNTAAGYFALGENRSGTYNIGIGYEAGYLPQNGSNNIEIGNYGLTKDTGVIRIGTQGTQRFTQIAGIWNTVVKSGQMVVVNAKGQIGVASTKLVSVANPATQADVLSLRQEIAGLRAQLNALTIQAGVK